MYKLTRSFAAIDPGKVGAIAIFNLVKEVKVFSLKGSDNDPKEIAKIITRTIHPEIPIYIESVHFIGGGKANASTFEFLRGAGAIEGACNMISTQVKLIKPEAWTGVIKASVAAKSGTAEWKGASRAIANSYLKNIGSDLTLSGSNDPGYGCSEAVLIGIYGSLVDKNLIRIPEKVG